jgi:hypothetical protein
VNAKIGPDSGHPSLYESAESATDKVAHKLKLELDKTPGLDFLMSTLGSFLYFAAQKLIDRKRKTGEERPKDEAVILSCSRLFNECFAGYLLARKGLVLQSIVLLRSAFEISSQGLLFMEREDVATRWLKGQRITPREVRGLSPFAAAARHLYTKLARLSHPNLEAIRYYTVALPKRRAIALAYGGWFSPKSVGQIAVQFLSAQLVFLEGFYAIYQDDLEAQGLLWRPETLEVVAKNFNLMRFGWSEFLAIWRAMVTEVVDSYNSLPDDAISIALHLDELGPPASERPKEGEPPSPST